MLTSNDIKKIIRIIRWNYFWSCLNVRSSPIYLRSQKNFICQLKICIRTATGTADIIFCKRWKDVCGGHDRLKEIEKRQFGDSLLDYLTIDQIAITFFKMHPKLLNKMPEQIKNKIMMLSI
jgi:hypothetical protein